jgi:hypothetical protein
MAAMSWHPQKIVGPQATEVAGGGRIFWGAAVDTNLVQRDKDGGDGEIINLYISLVNESTTKIQHVRLELIESVSLGTKNKNYPERTFQEVLWRLEHVPLDDDLLLETSPKLEQHLEQTSPAELQKVASRAVLGDLEQHRSPPVAITVPRKTRPSHIGRLTRIQHQVRLTLLTNQKNSQLMVPLWIV